MKDNRGKREVEKHHGKTGGREMEEQRRGGGGVGCSVNSTRTYGEKDSGCPTLKQHSKAAGVKWRQNCETRCALSANSYEREKPERSFGDKTQIEIHTGLYQSICTCRDSRLIRDVRGPDQHKRRC